MTKQKMMLVLGLAVLPGLALAQTTMRPRILTTPQSPPPATEVMPEWAKQTKALAERVAVLESQLNQSRQELAALKQAYESHTHKVPIGNLVYDNKNGNIVGFKPYAATVASARPGADAPGS